MCNHREPQSFIFHLLWARYARELCHSHKSIRQRAQVVHGLVSEQWNKGHLESEVVRITKWWRGQEAGKKCGVGEGESSSNGEQTTKSLESEWETDRTVARRGEDLFLTAAVSSVSKQTSLMSLCPALAAKCHSYTTLTAAKTGTGRDKQRKWDMNMKPSSSRLCYEPPWATFNNFRLANQIWIWQSVLKIPTAIILKPLKQDILLLEKHEQTCLIN